MTSENIKRLLQGYEYDGSWVAYVHCNYYRDGSIKNIVVFIHGAERIYFHDGRADDLFYERARMIIGVNNCGQLYVEGVHNIDLSAEQLAGFIVGIMNKL